MVSKEAAMKAYIKNWKVGRLTFQISRGSPLGRFPKAHVYKDKHNYAVIIIAPTRWYSVFWRHR